MATAAGSRGNRRDSTVEWTCDQDCWCHIPVRGVTPPPCYQCVLSHCSLSYKPDYIASAPELPPDNAYFSLIQNQAPVAAARDGISGSAEAAGGRTETLASLTTDPPHNSHTTISATPETSHIRDGEHNQVLTSVTTPTAASMVTPKSTPPATPSRQDSPHQSHNSGSSRHSPCPFEGIEGAVGGTEVVSSRLVFLEPQSSNLSLWNTLFRNNDNSLIPRTNSLVSSDNHSQADQSLVHGNLMVDDEIPNQPSLALSSGIRNVILRGDQTVNCDTEDSEVASYIPLPEQRSSPSSCDISSMESTSRHLDSCQSIEGDLSARLRSLILGSKDQELPQTNRNEQSRPLATTSWIVNARGMTVCACGDVHRCYTKKHSRTPTFKRRNQSSQAAHRPRYSVTSEVRGTNSSRPHSASTPSEHEFRNINRITGRESSRDAARRYLHSVIKP